MAQEARAILAGVAVALAVAAGPVAAQGAPRDIPWQQVAPEHQQVLAPIRPDWENFDAVQKRKWIGIAQRYPRLSTEEQERLQRRMLDWVALTPEMRQAVRDRYREFEQLPAEERQAVLEKWEQYQQNRAAAEQPAADAPESLVAGDPPPASAEGASQPAGGDPAGTADPSAAGDPTGPKP